MPTKREREYYRMGFRDGQRSGVASSYNVEYAKLFEPEYQRGRDPEYIEEFVRTARGSPRPKRKLSAWNKFVKANSKKPRFRYRNGKLNLKKMAIAFRKTPAGRKKRR